MTPLEQSDRLLSEARAWVQSFDPDAQYPPTLGDACDLLVGVEAERQQRQKLTKSGRRLVFGLKQDPNNLYTVDLRVPSQGKVSKAAYETARTFALGMLQSTYSDDELVVYDRFGRPL